MAKVVLVVDDDEQTRESMKELLEAKDPYIEVHTAKDPLDAISSFHKLKDSLGFVIVDYYMPVDNGLEFCKVVKSNKPSVQVLLFSGNQELRSGENSSNYVDKFFLKPDGRGVVDYITGA